MFPFDDVIMGDNRVDSTCGMIDKLPLASCKPIFAISRPSILIDPAAASTMRNKAKVIELLPAPVRPTMPTWNGLLPSSCTNTVRK